jgi:hypothetical protein
VLPVTAHDMIVHEARTLHERVADGWTDEAEASTLQFTGHGLGLVGFSRNLSS